MLLIVLMVIGTERFEIKIPSPEWNPIVIHIRGDEDVSQKLKGFLSFTGLFDFTVTKIPDFKMKIEKESEEKIKGVLTEISGKEVLNKEYSLKSTKNVAREMADDIIEKTTGMKGYFRSVMFFISDMNGSKELYRKKLLSEETEQITRFNSTVITPRVASDCSWVSFTAMKEGNWDVFLYEDGKITPFIETSAMETGLSLSPDRTFGVFSAFKGKEADIYMIDLKSGKKERLTEGGGIDVSPSISPDGKKIAFVSEREGHPQVYVMNIENKKVVRVSFGGIYCVSPVWSWDGKWIAYSCMEENGRMKVYVSSSDREEMRKITTGEGSDESPYFYPGSTFIVFTSNRDGDYDIYMTDISGAFTKKVTDTPYNEYEVAWCVEGLR